MSDREQNTPPQPRQPDQPPPDGSGRRSASPLLWILVLLALLAFGWFIYNQRAGVSTAPEAPPVIGIGDSADDAAERERAADDARQRTRREAESPERADRSAAPALPDREPVPLVRIEPDYPVEAYRAREEGTVLLSATVDANGRPRDLQVVRRSGSRELDQAAIDAVARWTFEPAIRNGKPAEAGIQVPVTFRIDR